ncbi:DUF2508 family protein [uncultured Tyzzerella sp.]|uniref:DUF2508 family protein n=1 Tax=uncultured Tyzzerella sp. TaxID=2321398 RepID=UPI002941DE6B|nr:DUF2508 family protein [uncultured Tyzzerella sp.]
MESLLLLKKGKNLLKTTNALDSEATEIIYFLQDIKIKLEYAEMCLNFTSDDTLIDSIIYEIISLQKRYDYFLKLSKKKEIVINFPQILQKFPAS